MSVMDNINDNNNPTNQKLAIEFIGARGHETGENKLTYLHKSIFSQRSGIIREKITSQSERRSFWFTRTTTAGKTITFKSAKNCQSILCF